MTDSFDRLVAFVDRRRRPILLGALALLVLSALSLVRLRLDMDLLSQLPSRSPRLADYRRYLQAFGAYDRLLIVVSGEPSKLVAFAEALATKLRALPEITSVHYRIDAESVRREWLAPHRFQLLTEEDYHELSDRLRPEAIAERVAHLRDALAMPMSLGGHRWVTEDPLGIDEILGRSIARRYADPLFRPSSEYFVAPSGDALLIVVRPARSAFDTIFSEKLMESVRRAEADLLGGPFAASELAIGHTGSYVYALADKKIIQRDLRLFFVFVPIAVLLILHLGLRTLRILPFIVLPLVLATAVTFALSLVLFRSLNMISVAFAGIFYGIGVDSSIYFYSALREHVRQHSDSDGLRRALASTLREIGVANVVASTTTAAAFAVIAFSDFTGVSQLGSMTAIAMLINIAGTFLLLPALVLAWGSRAVPAAAGRGSFAEAYGALAAAFTRRRRAVLVGAGAVFVAGVFGTTKLRLDTDFTHLRPGAGEAEQVEKLVQDRFGHLDAQGVALSRGTSLEECLERAEVVAARLERCRQDGIVRSYSTLTTFLPSQATAERRLALFRSLPRAEAASALRRALDRSGFAAETFDGFLRDWESDDRPPPRIDEKTPLATLLEQHLRPSDRETWVATYFVPAAGVSLAEVESRLKADPGTTVLVTGRALAEEEFLRLLRRELGWFLAATLLLNFMLVYLAERSLLRSVAILAPTLLALVAFSGIAGILDLAIDPINVIVLPLLIGLGVDDSVYLVAHIRHRGELRGGAARGVAPLFLAVATTVVGFGSLALSRYPALSRLGLLAAYGFMLCAVASLVLVPALMPLLDRRQTGSQK